MLILTMRTDKPESEIGLYEDDKQLVYETWPAHRQLAETLHQKIQELLKTQAKDWSDIQGVVVYKGPGSFTGLRIGLSVANALSTGLEIPVVSSTGDNWREQSARLLQGGENQQPALPEYGGEVFVTAPKK